MALHFSENTHDWDKEVTLCSLPVIVDFTATWCGPCRRLSPELDKCAETGKVKVVKVDVDQNPIVSQKWNVQGIPYVIMFKNGQQVDNFVGADVTKLNKWMESL